MAETPRLDLPYLAASQYQKEVYHNISLDRLDLLCQCAVLDRNLTAPPASPIMGDAYIVGPSATGAWAGHDNELALWVSSQWELIAPLPGFQCWVIDEAVLVYWSGTAWTIVTAGGGGASTFLALTDTPSTYSGQAGKTLLVNLGETALEFGTTAGSAPVDAPYVVTATHALLSAERVVTDTTDIQWDTTTAGQLKAMLVPEGVTLDKLIHQPQGTLLGRGDTLSATDVVQALTVGPGLTLEGTTLSATSGVSTFLDLTDTPEAYTGQAGKVVAVNAGATALEFITAASGSSAALGAEVQRVATFAVAQNTNVPVAWDTEVRDDAAFWSSGTATRLTIPSAGWYSLTASVQWDATTGVTRIINVRLNGVQYIAIESVPSAGVDQRQTIAVNWYLVAGDYLEIVLFQSTAGTRQVTGNCTVVGLTSAPDPATTFLALADTPDSYVGQAGKLVAVNTGATALEFAAGPVAAGTALSVARYASGGAALEATPGLITTSAGALGIGATPETSQALQVQGGMRVRGGPLELRGTDGVGTAIQEYVHSETAASTPAIIGTRGRGTETTPASPQANDPLMRVAGRGYNGTTLVTTQRAYMTLQATETWSGTGQGTAITWFTTATGTLTTLEKMRIDGNGCIGVGTPAPQFPLHVAGALAFALPTAEPASGDLSNGQMVWWVNESDNTLRAVIKRSDGTIRRVSLATTT